MRDTNLKVIKRSLIGIFAFMLFLMPINAVASTLDDLNSQKKAAESAAEEAAEKRAGEEEELDDLSKQIKNTSYQIADAEKAISITRDQLSETEANISKLEGEIATQIEKLEEEKIKMNKIVAAWYMEGADTSLLQTIVTSDTLSSAISVQEHYDSIANQIEATATELERLKVELEAQKEEQNQQASEQRRLKETQEAQKNSLASQKSVQNRLYNDTENVIAELKAEEIRAAELEKQIEAQINAILSAGSSYVGQPVDQGNIIGYEGNTGYSTGPHLHFMVFFNGDTGTNVNPRNYLGSSLIWPISGFRVTQEYGWTAFAKAGAYGGAPHNGIDITAFLGAPIMAAKSGTIILRQYFGGYGNAVVIDHGDGMYTLYGHMQG